MSCNNRIGSRTSRTSILLWFSYQTNASKSLYQTCDHGRHFPNFLAMHSVDCAEMPNCRNKTYPQNLILRSSVHDNTLNKMCTFSGHEQLVFQQKNRFQEQNLRQPDGRLTRENACGQNGSERSECPTQRWPKTNGPRRNEHGENSFESRPNGESHMAPPSWEHDNKG